MSSNLMVSMSTLQRKITEGNSNWEYHRPRLSGKIAVLKGHVLQLQRKMIFATFVKPRRSPFFIYFGRVPRRLVFGRAL